jgi:hypothetical protein
MMRCSPSPWPGVGGALPGWVLTKMGGSGAPDAMDQAHLTQVWLASGDDPKAEVTGQYFLPPKACDSATPRSWSLAPSCTEVWAREHGARKFVAYQPTPIVKSLCAASGEEAKNRGPCSSSTGTCRQRPAL